MSAKRDEAIKRRAERLRNKELLDQAQRTDKLMIETLRVCLKSEIDARERAEAEVVELKRQLKKARGCWEPCDDPERCPVHTA